MNEQELIDHLTKTFSSCEITTERVMLFTSEKLYVTVRYAGREWEKSAQEWRATDLMSFASENDIPYGSDECSDVGELYILQSSDNPVSSWPWDAKVPELEYTNRMFRTDTFQCSVGGVQRTFFEPWATSSLWLRKDKDSSVRVPRGHFWVLVPRDEFTAGTSWKIFQATKRKKITHVLHGISTLVKSGCESVPVAWLPDTHVLLGTSKDVPLATRESVCRYLPKRRSGGIFPLFDKQHYEKHLYGGQKLSTGSKGRFSMRDWWAQIKVSKDG